MLSWDWYTDTNFWLFRNKLAFGEYVHVHSAILKVVFVKFLQITNVTLKIHALEGQINSCYV